MMHRRSRLALVGFIAALWLGILSGACGPTVKPCGPSTCDGCCTIDGECVAGTSLFECGAAGGACSRCEVNATCSMGMCALIGGGVYDASFATEPDANYNRDAGVFDGGRADGGSTRSDAGFDAGMRNPDASVSFANEVQPIFDNQCNVCHVWGYSNTVSQMTCCSSTCIAPGNPGNSALWGKISGNPPCGEAMPRNRPPLSAYELETIRLWIVQGAKNN